MFTGIVQGTGTLCERSARGGDARLRIACAVLPPGTCEPGASVAVNGVCLTVVAARPGFFEADASTETLRRTTLGALAPGAAVNLEPALALGAPLGGHLVSGHVDGVGEILERRADARALRLRIAAPGDLARFLAPKGSVAVDGVSLTVNAAAGPVFDVAIVPATRERTIIGGYAVADRVNLEVDLVARYLERLLEARTGP